ncbi:MAG TPA: hypothetical protein VL295_10015, partial [Gemmatimonadales bacterium]|nr:hypothetical protein [Gemmatimonadales bacterium]
MLALLVAIVVPYVWAVGRLGETGSPSSIVAARLAALVSLWRGLLRSFRASCVVRRASVVRRYLVIILV